MLNSLFKYVREYDFPEECGDALSEAYFVIGKNEKHEKELRFISNFRREEDDFLPFNELTKRVENLSKETGIHVYTLWLLVFILMSDKFFHDSMRLHGSMKVLEYSMYDLKYKAVECHLVKGVWGNFVSSWSYGFFTFKLFGFSALQFEPIEASKDFDVNGRIIKKGTKLLSVHIPRREKHLNEQEVEQNFKEVIKFFKLDDPIFYCHSWLLFPKNKNMISSDSHIRHFIDLFTLIETYEAPNYSEMWRLFDMEINENNLDTLPANTSFRRGYIQLMKNKEKTGGGVGIYIPSFKD